MENITIDNLYNEIETTRQGLAGIKKDVIGILKLRNNVTNGYELVVVEHDNDTLNTINITPFGAINESFFIPKHFGEYRRFPENKNMEEMLQDPFEWKLFINNFK